MTARSSVWVLDSVRNVWEMAATQIYLDSVRCLRTAHQIFSLLTFLLFFTACFKIAVSHALIIHCLRSFQFSIFVLNALIQCLKLCFKGFEENSCFYWSSVCRLDWKICLNYKNLIGGLQRFSLRIPASNNHGNINFFRKKKWRKEAKTAVRITLDNINN